MKTALICILVLSAFILLCYLLGTVLFKFSLDTKSVFYLPHLTNKRKKTEEELKNLKKRKEMDDYIHQNSTQVFKNSFDGLKLSGYLMKAETESHKYAILCHGYDGSPAEMLRFGLHYKELGFNSLFIDQRCYGQSEGRYCTMSVNESKDVKSWIEYILSTDSQAVFGLHGISMGAASVMNVLALNIPENVKFVVEDCGFTSIWEVFSYQLKVLLHMPVHPFINLASFGAYIHMHISYHQGNCIKALEQTKVPVMFAHGTADIVVPFYMEKQLYDACNSKKTLLEVENAEHTKAVKVNEAAYFKMLDEFIAPLLT